MTNGATLLNILRCTSVVSDTESILRSTERSEASIPELSLIHNVEKSPYTAVALCQDWVSRQAVIYLRRRFTITQCRGGVSG